MNQSTPNQGASPLKYCHLFDDIDLSSPTPHDVNHSGSMCSSNSILNKSFVLNNQANSVVGDDEENVLQMNSFDISIRMLEDMKAAMLLQESTDHGHLSDETKQDSLVTKRKLNNNMLDKSTQAELISIASHLGKQDKNTQTNILGSDFVVKSTQTGDNYMVDKSTQVELRLTLPYLGKQDKNTHTNILGCNSLIMSNNKGENKSIQTSVTAESVKDVETQQDAVTESREPSSEVIEKIQIQLDQLTTCIKDLEILIKTKESKKNSQKNKTMETTKLKPKCIQGKYTNYTNKSADVGIDPLLFHQVQVNILGDSHGRELSIILKSLGVSRVEGLIKPNANADEILETNVIESKNENLTEIKVIIAGANNVYRNDAETFLRALRKYLVSHTQETIILYTIPTRYDLPIWSIVNVEIRKVNYKIKGLMKKFRCLCVIDIEGLGRRFHTNHGMHLNALGKRYMGVRLLEEINLVQMKLAKEKNTIIPLMWINQGNV